VVCCAPLSGRRGKMATLKAVCVMKGDGPVQGVIYFQQQARAGGGRDPVAL